MCSTMRSDTHHPTVLSRVVLGLLPALLGLLCACHGPQPSNAQPQATPSTPDTHRWKPAPLELFPGVRIDPDQHIVQFPAFVAMDCHDPETPDVYLEVICCERNSREHESLLVTDIAPSLIHAALLAAGFEPGTPGRLPNNPQHLPPQEPTGDPIEIRFILQTVQSTRIESPTDWIIDNDSHQLLSEHMPDTHWVFAGSRWVTFHNAQQYEADLTGQLIGLHTFGSETIAWTHLESPEAATTEPHWLANASRVPAIGQPVVVELSAVDVSKTHKEEPVPTTQHNE